MRFVVRRAVRGMSLLVLAVALSVGPRASSVIAQDSPPGSATVYATEAAELRQHPGHDAPVLATLTGGEPAEVIGAVTMAADGSAWVPVVAAGQSGFLPAGIVSGTPPATEAALQAPPAASEAAEASDAAIVPEVAAAAPPAEEASGPATAVPAGSVFATTSDVNLRSGPSPEADVLRVLLPGTPVSVDGAAVNGFVPVTADGTSGWIAAEFLGGVMAESSPVAEAADPTMPEASPPPPAAPAAESASANETRAPRERASTGIAWPFRGGTWQVIQGYNGGTHQNRSGFAQYYYALDWARVDGDTAGQPVYAPVSGTIEWVDRGSGGLLMNAGNGYGVALFHITLDGGIGRGGAVQQGQRIGVVSGPGGDGFMSTPHVDMTLWELSGGGHEATPFTGPNAIAGQEFPDIGGANQHMGVQVTP